LVCGGTPSPAGSPLFGPAKYTRFLAGCNPAVLPGFEVKAQPTDRILSVLLTRQ